MQAGGQVEEIPIPVEECMALVERVAASQELRRASRLRDFLLYVCSQTLERGASVIHEQEIGEAVFERPRSYDTAIDNIVRVNATGLRKRLEHYFEEEGAREQMVIEIPRGNYTPVFRRRLRGGAAVEALPGTIFPSEGQVANTTQTALAVDRPATQAQWKRLIWPFVSIVLTLVCAALLLQNESLDRQVQPWKHQPSLRAFWGSFFDTGGETDVVLADTSFALAEDMMQRSVPLSDYVNYHYKQLAESPEFSADQRADLSLVLDRNNGSAGDFRVAQLVMALNANPKKATLKFAREYTTGAARQNNLVLIGSEESNPWVDLFGGKLNFVLQYDPVARQPLVVNKNPHAGEQASYALPAGSRIHTAGYGVIAYVPNISGKGRALILEGTDSQATAATGEFMTSEDSLAAFERKLPAGPIPSFEILLRTSQLSGTPIQAEIVAFRIYPNAKN